MDWKKNKKKKKQKKKKKKKKKKMQTRIFVLVTGWMIPYLYGHCSNA